jgi:hypothetical protein
MVMGAHQDATATSASGVAPNDLTSEVDCQPNRRLDSADAASKEIEELRERVGTLFNALADNGAVWNLGAKELSLAVRTDTLKPALAGITDSCKYLGGVSRAKFYSDLLPLLETVHFGTRHFVVVASMDRLIESLLTANRADRNGLEQATRASIVTRAAHQEAV